MRVIEISAGHLPQNSIVRERGTETGSLKTEQDRRVRKRYCDSYRPRRSFAFATSF